MRRIVNSRPSPVIVIAILALVAAVAGTAVAADPVATTSVSKKKVKKIARKQAEKFFNANIGKASVAHAATADSANTANNANSANSANSATTAGSAPPFAYARVRGSDGTVSPDRPSRNIASGNISNPQPGVYCFDLPFTPKTGAATSQADAGSDDIAMIELRGTTGGLGTCPDTSEVKVINYDVGSGAQLNDSFYIQLDI